MYAVFSSVSMRIRQCDEAPNSITSLLALIVFNEHVLFLSFVLPQTSSLLPGVSFSISALLTFGYCLSAAPLACAICCMYFRGLLPDAGSFTVLDVVFRGRPELPCNVFGRQCQVAGTERIQFFISSNRPSWKARGCTGEVIRTVANNLPGLVDAWKYSLLMQRWSCRPSAARCILACISWSGYSPAAGHPLRVHHDVADVGNLETSMRVLADWWSLEK